MSPFNIIVWRVGMANNFVGFKDTEGGRRERERARERVRERKGREKTM